MDGKKKCSRCGKVKPFTEFRTYAGRSRDGYRPCCKVCQRAYEQTVRDRKKEEGA